MNHKTIFVSALRAFCRQNKSDITWGQLTALVNTGKVKQSRDGYWMDDLA